MAAICRRREGYHTVSKALSITLIAHRFSQLEGVTAPAHQDASDGPRHSRTVHHPPPPTSTSPDDETVREWGGPSASLCLASSSSAGLRKHLGFLNPPLIPEEAG